LVGGLDENIFGSYIEFAFRDSERAKKKELYQELFDEFERFVSTRKCNFVF